MAGAKRSGKKGPVGSSGARRGRRGIPPADPRDFGRDGDPALYVIFQAPWGWDFLALRDYSVEAELEGAELIEGTAALAEWACKHLRLSSHPVRGES